MKAIEKLAAEHDALLGHYDALLSLLARAASGEVDPGRVEVDLQARTWRVAPEAPPIDWEAGRRAVTIDDPQADADGNGTHVE